MGGWLRALPVEEVLAIPAAVLVAFLRVVTQPRIYPEPTPVPLALAFTDRMRAHPAHQDLTTGPEHWRTMRRQPPSTVASAGSLSCTP